jgi:F0F1-type ATP synthase delta subunit
MSKPSRRRLAQATLRLLQEQPSERPQILRSVAGYLIAHKQVGQLHLLVSDLARELEIGEGHLYAQVNSAFALDDKTRSNLRMFLQTKTGAKTVEFDESVDPSLLAGVVVRTPNEELDISARRKLTNLASLNSGGDF